jgi:beta-N-acetylhexosaminidase
MPVPTMRATAVGVAVAIVLTGIGVAVWQFVIRDENVPQETEVKPKKEKRERVSGDPVVRQMSVAEQARQVLMLGFDGTEPDAPGVAELTENGTGAVIVRSENWTGAEAGRKLVARFAQADGIPPVVTASQEGGIYRSFGDLPPPERELDIGRSESPDAVRVWSQTTSKALADAGFDLNLFPVADVATLDSPLAGRAFSDDPALVAALTEDAIRGCEDAGIACAPAHFPGLGSASQDTAEGPATVVSPVEVLASRDMVPFRAVAKDVPAMVLSLALYPDFDAVVPGAMTEGVATGLLRDEVGFRGVAISDDLGAGAVTFQPREAAVRALAAGTDLVQIGSPEDADGVADAIAKAVKDERIPPERLAEAAERVIELKRELGLIE